jgi:hypothetical protein
MEIPHPAVRRVRGVLDLDPMFAATGAVRAVQVLRDNALEVHVAGDLEQHVTDVASFVLRNEYAVDRIIR